MSTPKTFIVDPALPNCDVTVGSEGNQSVVYLGQVAEFGGARRVFFDASKEFVSLIIGKRGSGKSFCLGSLLEGLCTANPETSISRIAKHRGVLLLDPMGNFGHRSSLCAAIALLGFASNSLCSRVGGALPRK